jgi:TPP-dependent pyruvate/acetoin dehydrogenase alpha subunit
VEAVCYRFATHSTATRETRDPVELATWQARCPIRRLAAHLPEALSAGHARDVADAVADAIRFAESSPLPEAADLLDNVG